MTALTRALHASTRPFQEDFAQHALELPGARLDWLETRRHAAMSAFAATGIPDRRVEAWKWTDLANALQGEPERPAASGSATGAPILFPTQECELFFVDGGLRHASPKLGVECVDLSKLDGSAPAWVCENLGTLAQGPDQPMGAASLALMRGGAAIRITQPVSLHVQFTAAAASRPAVSHSRLLLLVEPAISVRLIESHGGGEPNGSLRNLGIELRLMPGSKLEHVRLQRNSGDALHVTSLGVEIGRGANYRAVYASLGGRIARLDVNLRLVAEHSAAVIHSIAALAAGVADITTVTDHASRETRSRQLFKNVVGGNARAVNQGRVIVRPGAQKSDSHQLFKSLLRSRHAEADAKPELEIFDDDVQCGHGTAIGALDDDALFYLRSRGIPAGEAKLLLVRAFAAEVMDEIADNVIREVLWREVDATLAQVEATP